MVYAGKMLSLPNAVLLSALIIALALLVPSMIDRYEPAGSFTIDGTPGVWRINPRTGRVTSCLLLPDPTPRTNDPAEKYFTQCRAS
jgi:hypothetical protein